MNDRVMREFFDLGKNRGEMCHEQRIATITLNLLV